MSRRLLVCGSRSWTDRKHLYATLDRLHQLDPIEVVIHGAARGADTMAGEWAAERGVPVLAFPADWKHNGKAAPGPDRWKRRSITPEGIATAMAHQWSDPLDLDLFSSVA